MTNHKIFSLGLTTMTNKEFRLLLHKKRIEININKNLDQIIIDALNAYTSDKKESNFKLPEYLNKKTLSLIYKAITRCSKPGYDDSNQILQDIILTGVYHKTREE